ncbi:GNAT family N-acetyltransferase [Streptococcus caviae]|uniref:GNAT family N-acetyltransferase n=1 Tax=Streptococcus sp. 'caviae' TaxID=1915004 RepID=UPI00094BC621|nr:GNAT family N-acetyltransferase [Streptococcus sp. 'caviae']OLN84666.1 GNAT family N-acetyltransferase [Streptococcus sp. 'caviae']
MTYTIREMKNSEFGRLDDFLYEAIFIPKGMEKPDKDIIKRPELQLYVKDFGSQFGDFCLVAEIDQQLVGAVWSRIMDDYGHINDDTPSLSISLFEDYRGQGIGTALMKEMLTLLKTSGFKAASLSVQKANYAVKLYRKLGFGIYSEKDEELIMVVEL